MANLHHARRAAILDKHPEIKPLMQPDGRTALLTLALVLVQTSLAVTTPVLHLTTTLLLAYLVGAICHHMLFLCVHEASHHLIFKRPAHNQAVALLANLPSLLPFAGVFRTYHLAHHYNQGEPEHDTDLPSDLEVWLIRTSATGYVDRCVRKALYLSVYLPVYAIRPLLSQTVRPPVTLWVVANAGLQALFCAGLAHLAGTRALLYLACSTFFAGSLHPVASHFQAEHTVQISGVDTYSYYGVLNYVSLNVGYHNEHHDFPNVPWTQLPQVRALAPEFYTKQRETAWPGLLWRYVVDDALGPQARLKHA